MVFYKYLYILLFFKIYILCQNGTEFINNNGFSINNSIYKITNREGNLNLIIKDSAYFIKEENKNMKNNYYLFINENENRTNNEEAFFYIKDISLDIKLSSSNKENKIIKYSDNLDKDYALWKIIPKINENNQLIYYIQNKKTKKYWYYSEPSYRDKIILTLIEEKYLNKNNEFKLIELQLNSKNTIFFDLLIKYKDLPIQKANISKISKIKKEHINEMMRFFILYILKNIYWVRKIFILIPNEQINFLKLSKDIKKRIVLLKEKEKDILEFNFTSDNIFGFNMLKMKKFGLNKYFIFLNNSFFIDNPLNKSNFFYEENGIIVPYLISNSFYEINKEIMQKKIDNFLLNNNNTEIYFEKEFDIIKQKAILFLYEIFGNDDISHEHKLIKYKKIYIILPIKMSEIEEIYYYIFKNSDKYMNKSFFDLFSTSFDFNLITWNFYNSDILQKIKTKSLKLFKFSKINNYNKRFLNELYHKKNKFRINMNFKEEIENKTENKEIFNTNDISLINFIKIKYNNETFLDQIKKIEENITLLFKGIDSLIDKISIVINETLKFYHYNSKESNKTNNIDILLKEINYLKKEYITQIIINIFLFCFIIFFISNKFRLYYKYRNTVIYMQKNKYKKHKNINFSIFM